MKTARKCTVVFVLFSAGIACEDPAQLLTPGDGGAGGTSTGGTSGSGGSMPDRSCAEMEVEDIDHGWQPLSGTQYRNTVSDLFAWMFGPVEGKAFVEKLKPRIDEVAAYRPKRVSESGDLVTEAEFLVATDAAQLIAALPPERFFNLVGAPAANEGAVTSWVRQFATLVASRAFRAPPPASTVDELASYHPRAATLDMGALAQMVGVVLASPEFLWRIEHGANAAVIGSPRSYPLTAFELASRLSYHFWDAPPDAELMQAASDGSLLESSSYDAQIARMLADPRAHPSIRQFLYEMLDLDSVARPNASIANARYKIFAGVNQPTQGLRQSIIDEALDMGEYAFFHDENYASLLQAGRSFARTQELANLYGAPIWDGLSPPPPLDNRPGILSHAWLMVAQNDQRPFMHTGYKLRAGILCDSAPAPPAGFTDPRPPAVGMTGREALELLYQGPCRGCHDYFATLAYPFDGFDALARVRTEETIFDVNDNPSGKKPVNTQSVPQVWSGDSREVDGAAALIEQMLETEKVHACLSRHLLTYTFPTPPESFISEPGPRLLNAAAPPAYPYIPLPIEPSNGSCAIDQVRDVARQGSLLEAFAATARLGAFKTRAFDQILP